jgi:hypothetical protein
VESLTNDSNLFDKSYALWGFKITQNTQFEQVLVETRQNQFLQNYALLETRTE